MPNSGIRRSEHLPGQRDGHVRRRRVAGAVGQEEPVGRQLLDPLDRGVGGQHVRLDAPGGEHPRGVRLDADVQRRHPEPGCRAGGAVGGDDVLAGRGHRAVEVGAHHRRPGPDPVDQLGVGSHAPAGGGRTQRSTGEHAGLHRPPLAQVPDQRAGVDPRHADDPLRLERVVQRPARPPARRRPRRVAHDVAGHLDAARLVVLVVPAGVADLRRGRDDDLAVVAGVGERLLVAGHRGAEHRLAQALPGGAVALAAEDPAVLEHQKCRARHAARTQLATFPSRTAPIGTVTPLRAVIRPRSTVAATVAGSRMPS